MDQRIEQLASVLDAFPARADATRRVTDEVPGIGGRLRERPSDFLVDEQPLYQPSGAGEHIYLLVEKEELTTLQAVRILATHFGVRPEAVGYAGLKDRAAITRQVISIHAPGKRLESFPMVRHDKLRVLWADYHANKLRRGHLLGNRFSVRIRGVQPTAAVAAKRVLELLARRGVPNRIGSQRFGYLGRNHVIGRAIVLGRPEEAIDALLLPTTGAHDSHRPAREAWMAGDPAAARDMFGYRLRAERAACGALARGLSPGRVLRTIDRVERSFFVSAFQSAVFNAVLDARLESGGLDTLGAGDIAMKSPGRATFDVDDALASDPSTRERLARFEIAPTGPMWGSAMRRAAGEVGRLEEGALRAAGVKPQDLDAFESRSPGMCEGDRRPLRVAIVDPDVEGGVDEHGPYVRCAFELPRGSFATVVLDEVMKAPAQADPHDDEAD